MTTNVQTEKASPVTTKRFRVEDFRRMTEIGILPEEAGWEVIDGYLINKTTTGSKHAATVKKLNRVLTNLVGSGAIISVRDPVHIDDFNQPEPHIAILKRREDFYAENHPRAEDVLLLIEGSDSTLEYDRDIKNALYAEAGVVEFRLVNLKENTIECFSSPKNGNYRLARIFEPGETIESKTIENLTLEVAEVLAA